ncbi:MAG: cobaltochelatase subunit CobN [Thermodesulfovibrionales bacterium]|nr:cobaltochelatase subunit CobN [Thermodesulfovibrionales bacterium]
MELLRSSLLWQHRRHSRFRGNPEKKWIPYQARNDKIGLHKFFLITVFFIIFFTTTANAEPVKVSLLLGDTHSKTAIEAIKLVRSPDISFHVYPSKDIRSRDLKYLKDSRLIIINIMGRQLVEMVKPEIEDAIKNAAKVYAVAASGSYNEEMKGLGIVLDKKIAEYYQHGGVENIKNMILFAMKRDLGLDVSYKEPVPIPDFGIYLKKEKRIVETIEEFFKHYQPNLHAHKSAQGNMKMSSPFPDLIGESRNKELDSLVKPENDILGAKKDRPWIGITFYKSIVDSGDTAHLDFLIDSLEKEGFNVLPVYGYPSESVVERFFFDEKGKSRVSLVVAMSLKIGLNPQVAVPLLSRLNVPLIDAITLYTQSKNEWEKSPVGLDIFERAWQVAMPEMGGIIQPTVIASKERAIDKETGIEYIEERPIPERIKRLVDRIKAWINLQDKQNKDKKVAIIYYNYPPGKQNIGASYLNVLPESLYEIINRLRAEGYNAGDNEISKERLFNDIHNYARNIGNWAGGEIDRLARTGKPVLIPIETYKRWFEELPEGLKKSIVKNWGEPEDNNIMAWTGGSGTKYIVIPAVQYGNILFTPQPSRGWEQDAKKLYHDVTLAPHHQYVAFYLWLKRGFQADAIAHIGTHGTHEWLSGKEVGFTNEDPPEALIQDLPNIYPYIVDDVGEGLQAKRRGMAVIIDHMTPPFDKAGMNKELKELAASINDYKVAKEKSPSLAQSKLDEINSLAKKIGIFTDLKLNEIKTSEEMEELGHYIKDISEKQTPFGLHTFGKAPDEKYRRSTAEAILSIEKGLSKEEMERRIADYEQRIVQSGKRELDSFVAALSGRYIPAGQGNDPIRNPDSLPTGKNFYSFDPTRIPSKGNYEIGVRLAKELIEGYKLRHGIYPDKLTSNLWGVETIRHEGVMESQIMYLMGIKPKWDERGRVVGVEAIPRSELGRPRIDVTIVPSGLYRDLFSNLMALLDKAVTLAKEQVEEDNLIRQNVLKTKKMLMEKGIEEDKAERLASVRLFTVPSGAYGTNLDKVIPLSNTWDNERQVADVYFMRMSHLYGQGFWGEKIEHQSSRASEQQEDVSLLLFKNALSGSKIAVHSRSGNVYATLDNDDFFQYLGGTAMAIRVLDGKTPEVYITNMSNPKQPKQETLEKFMGREMRSRYLNPEWIKAMMKEGYAGARFIDKAVEHLWGWQVTVPEAVDSAKWNEMYETYVLDRNGLGIKEMFRKSKNMWAYQSIVARMLETVRKDYWKADKKVVETLAKEYAESVKDVGLACCDHTCNNPQLTKFTSSVLMSVPGLKAQVSGFMKALKAVQSPESRVQSQKTESKAGNRQLAPDGRGKKVEGYEMQDMSASSGGQSAPIPYLFLIGFLVFIGLIMFGFRKKH